MAKGRKPAISNVARPQGFIDDVVIGAAKKVGKAVASRGPVNFARKKMGKSYYVNFGPDFGKAKVSYPKVRKK